VLPRTENSDLKSGPAFPSLFETEQKAPCPNCSQPLTFVRTKTREKRWYCYACEKYIDDFKQPSLAKDMHSRLDSLQGLQVVDSHGILIGRVRKAIPTESGDLKSLLLFIDKEQFKSLLDDREWPKEYEVQHEKISTIGDVVILSDVFSPSALAPSEKIPSSPHIAKCGHCGADILPDAKHCIKCGAIVSTHSCTRCGTVNPFDAKYCKDCGNRLSQ
jgi:sporulation protein YlmC with PRC-barrel domain/ribosomal protein L40E